MAKLSIKGKGPSLRGYALFVDGHKISGVTSLTLYLEDDGVNSAKLGFLVDEVESDTEVLATPISPATDTKLCPACGKFMVRWYTDRILRTCLAPPPWTWRCGCGYQERGSVECGKTTDDLFRETWEAANRPRPL